MDEKLLNEIMPEMDLIYQFILTGSDNMARPHDYGTGEVLNMVEMHTLAMIEESPGICISEIARLWNRTLGAASRNVDKLQNKGYIEKKKLTGNNKTVRLYPTEKGKYLAELHKQFDDEKIRRITEQVLNCHTPEEIRAFFSVLKQLAELIKE